MSERRRRRKRTEEMADDPDKTVGAAVSDVSSGIEWLDSGTPSDIRAGDDEDVVETGIPRRSNGTFAPGGPGGPGRGRTRRKTDADRGRQQPTGKGEGVRGVLDAVVSAIEQDPAGFADQLVRKSPVSAAQFVMSLGKYAEADGQPTEVKVVTTSPYIEAVALQASDPAKAAELWGAVEAVAETTSAQVENERLRRENEKLEARVAALEKAPRDSTADPEPEATWTCRTCKRLAGVTRVYPVTQSVCSRCGQVRTADGRQHQPEPGAGADGGECVAFVAGGRDRGGWVGISSLSELRPGRRVGSVGEAVAGLRGDDED